MPMQQRQFPRIRLRAETAIKAIDGAFTGLLENISVGGMFVRTNKRLEVGFKTEIAIPLPSGSRDESLVVNGIATRIDENGVAFKFYKIQPNTFLNLLSFINIQMPRL